MASHPVLFDFDNMGFLTPGRLFAGFPKSRHGLSKDLAPREILLIEMGAGDLLSIAGPIERDALSLVAFDDRGQDASSLLGLSADTPLDTTLSDCRPLLGWLAARGGDPAERVMTASMPENPDQLVLSTQTPLSLWVIHTLTREGLSHGAASRGPIHVTHQPKARSGPVLPPELGVVRDEFTVTRGTGRAYELKRGETVQIIDIEINRAARTIR